MVRASESSYTGHSPGSSDVSVAFEMVCFVSSDSSCEKNVYESWVVVKVVGSDDVGVDMSRVSSISRGGREEMSVCVEVPRKNDWTWVVVVESCVSICLSSVGGGSAWSDSLSVGETEHHNGSAP